MVQDSIEQDTALAKPRGVQVMQNFAAELSGKGVRVFSVHPGSYYTPGVAANMSKDMVAWEDVVLPAHFIRWLAGSESDFLHGRFVHANWDVDEIMALKDRIAKEPAFLTIA